MKIKSLKADNFKSFSGLDVTLGDLNVLIGSNASGKSNFLDVLRFLRNLERYGPDNAVSLQGGGEHLLNTAIGPDRPFSVEVGAEHESERGPAVRSGDRLIGLRLSGFTYSGEIRFHKGGKGHTLTRDEIKIRYKAYHLREKQNPGTDRLLGEETLRLSDRLGSLHAEFHTDIIKSPDVGEIFPTDLISESLAGGASLISAPGLIFPRFGRGFFGEMSLYDFSSGSVKGPSPVAGKIVLEEDAGNLSIVLKNLISRKEKRKKLISLISDVLPFVTDMRVNETSEKSLCLELKETFSDSGFLPSVLLSDGTLHAVAVIVALYFGPRTVSVFEEPERNLHPELVARLSSHIRDISKKKQIIVTTHDTEFLRNVGADDVLFISRPSDGFSRVSRLSDREDVKHFLENDIGIDELYAGNLITG